MFLPLAIGAGFLAFFWPKKAQASVGPSASALYGPYLPKGGLPVNASDLDIMARTLWGEARGEGTRGMQAVANVIMNRYRLAQQYSGYAKMWGRTVAEICQKKYQFSVWLSKDPNLPLMRSVTTADPDFREALAIAEKALKYQLPDITGGAAYYHTKAILPDWAEGIQPIRTVGSHKFYTASQVA